IDLKEHFPYKWIGRIGENDNALIKWPSWDLTPYDFFLLGFVKDNAYVPPLLANLQALSHRITTAMTMLECVWGHWIIALIFAISARMSTLSIFKISN
ncbi:hypothetical protein C0J52_20473, partial [Blattella germanica]